MRESQRVRGYAIRRSKGEVNQSRLGRRSGIAPGKKFEVIAVPGVEHCGAAIGFAPGELDREAKALGVKADGGIEISDFCCNVVKSAAAEFGILHSRTMRRCEKEMHA